MYCFVGASTALIFVIVSESMRRVAELETPAAAAFGFIASLLPAFLGHRHLTFQSEANPTDDLRRFIFTNISLFFLTICSAHFLTGVFSLWPSAVFVITAVIVPCLNFFILKFYVFARRARDAEQA
jgi:putative flippase GtrA